MWMRVTAAAARNQHGVERRGKAAPLPPDLPVGHEGDEFRRWVQRNLPEHFFIACGDRHWQYHSVHPDTGVQEFSCGPASDQHAASSPG